MPKQHSDYGPTWLDEYADRLASNDQAMEAVAFRQMAAQWNADRAQIDAVQTENSQLQVRADRVARAAAAVAVEAGAPA